MSVISVEIQKRVAIVEYNNKPLNILTIEYLALIEDTLLELEKDNAVSVILFTMKMQKNVFCAGMDLDEMLATKGQEKGIENYCELSKRYYSVFNRIAKPTIYVFDGVTRGGGVEMSLFADFRFAGEKINIALPEIGIGIIPGGGGTQMLLRLIGESAAKELILSGKTVKAAELKELGLINRIISSDLLMEEALEFALALAKHSPQGLQAAKRAINAGRNVDLTTGLNLETVVFAENFATGDATEGIAAFKEKRKPVYKNC